MGDDRQRHIRVTGPELQQRLAGFIAGAVIGDTNLERTKWARGIDALRQKGGRPFRPRSALG